MKMVKSSSFFITKPEIFKVSGFAYSYLFISSASAAKI